MQGALEDFFRALRAADVKVSPAEAIDAHRTVEKVGFADRELFKDALCATLAKTSDEVVRFDETFETFFARDEMAFEPPPQGEGDPMAGLPEGSQESELARMLMEGDVAGLAQAMEEAAERAQVSQIRLTTQRSRLTRRLLEEMGLAEIEAIIANARRAGGGEGADRLEAGKRRLAQEAQRYVEQQHSVHRAPLHPSDGTAHRHEF